MRVLVCLLLLCSGCMVKPERSIDARYNPETKNIDFEMSEEYIDGSTALKYERTAPDGTHTLLEYGKEITLGPAQQMEKARVEMYTQALALGGEFVGALKSFLVPGAPAISPASPSSSPGGAAPAPTPTPPDIAEEQPEVVKDQEDP